MEADIKAGKYLEHGEYEGNLYGTKIDSILEVVQTGRTCILDVNPQVSCTDSKTVFKILILCSFVWFYFHIVRVSLSITCLCVCS